MRVASGKASRVSTYQFSQRQLRGLVALLVLLPWIPVTLLWQVWRESNTHQREATRERLAAGYQQMLRSADNSLKRHLSQHPPQEAPKAAQLFFEDLFGQDLVVRLVNPQGTALGSSEPTPGEPLTQHFLEKAGLPWRVEVFLRNPGTALAGGDPTPVWILGLCISVTAGIAVTAGITVSRQIALRELYQRHTAKGKSLTRGLGCDGKREWEDHETNSTRWAKLRRCSIVCRTNRPAGRENGCWRSNTGCQER